MVYSSAKSWWFYWFLMPFMYAGAVYMFYVLVYKFAFLEKSEFAKARKQSPEFLGMYCVLLIILLGCFLVVRNYANYLYGVELTKSGIYWRDWDRGHLMKWNQVISIESYTNMKGRPAAIITAKNGEFVKADSLAFAHWDNFIGDVAKYSGRPINETGFQTK